MNKKYKYLEIKEMKNEDGVREYDVIRYDWCLKYGIILSDGKNAEYYHNKDCEWEYDKNICLELAMILEELEEGKFAE